MEEQNDSDSDDESKIEDYRSKENLKRNDVVSEGRGFVATAMTLATGSRNIGTSIKTNEAWIANEAEEVCS